MKARILSVKKRPHVLRWGLGALVVSAVAAGILYGHGDRVKSQEYVSMDGRADAVPSPLALGDEPSATTSAPTARDRAKPTGVAPAPAPTSLNAKYAALKVGTPKERYEAYRLVADCVEKGSGGTFATTLGKFGIGYPAQHEVCGDLTPGDKAEAQSLLIAAAKAGVHNAFRDLALDQAQNGPMAKHTGVYLPDSAQTKALLDEALAAAIGTADPFALIVASTRLRNGSQEDKAQALVYYLAMLEVRGVEIPATKVKVPSLEDATARDLISQLPADVVRDSVAKAAVLAKRGLS